MLIKHNTYRLGGISCRDCFIPIELALKGLKGVIEVKPDFKGKRVMVTYDLERVRSEQIEEMVGMAGYPVRKNLLQKVKFGMIHFTEQNIVDNRTAKPPDCCSNPKHIN